MEQESKRGGLNSAYPENKSNAFFEALASPAYSQLPKRMVIIVNLVHLRPIIFLQLPLNKNIHTKKRDHQWSVWAGEQTEKNNSEIKQSTNMTIIIILIIRIMRMNYKIQIENCFICHPGRSHFAITNNTPRNNKRETQTKKNISKPKAGRNYSRTESSGREITSHSCASSPLMKSLCVQCTMRCCGCKRSSSSIFFKIGFAALFVNNWGGVVALRHCHLAQLKQTPTKSIANYDGDTFQELHCTRLIFGQNIQCSACVRS